MHLSRQHTIEVLEQVLLSVRQDVADRPSPHRRHGLTMFAPSYHDLKTCSHKHLALIALSPRGQLAQVWSHCCDTETPCFFKLLPATGAKEVQAAKLDGEARSHTPLSRHPCRVRVRRETQKSAYAYSGGAEQGGFCCRGRPAAVRCVYCTCAVMNSRDVLVCRVMCSY